MRTYAILIVALVIPIQLVGGCKPKKASSRARSFDGNDELVAQSLQELSAFCKQNAGDQTACLIHRLTSPALCASFFQPTNLGDGKRVLPEVYALTERGDAYDIARKLVTKLEYQEGAVDDLNQKRAQADLLPIRSLRNYRGSDVYRQFNELVDKVPGVSGSSLEKLNNLPIIGARLDDQYFNQERITHYMVRMNGPVGLLSDSPSMRDHWVIYEADSISVDFQSYQDSGGFDRSGARGDRYDFLMKFVRKPELVKQFINERLSQVCMPVDSVPISADAQNSYEYGFSRLRATLQAKNTQKKYDNLVTFATALPFGVGSAVAIQEGCIANVQSIDCSDAILSALADGFTTVVPVAKVLTLTRGAARPLISPQVVMVLKASAAVTNATAGAYDVNQSVRRFQEGNYLAGGVELFSAVIRLGTAGHFTFSFVSNSKLVKNGIRRFIGNADIDQRVNQLLALQKNSEEFTKEGMRLLRQSSPDDLVVIVGDQHLYSLDKVGNIDAACRQVNQSFLGFASSELKGKAGHIIAMGDVLDIKGYAQYLAKDGSSRVSAAKQALAAAGVVDNVDQLAKEQLRIFDTIDYYQKLSDAASVPRKNIRVLLGNHDLPRDATAGFSQKFADELTRAGFSVVATSPDEMAEVVVNGSKIVVSHYPQQYSDVLRKRFNSPGTVVPNVEKKLPGSAVRLDGDVNLQLVGDIHTPTITDGTNWFKNSLGEVDRFQFGVTYTFSSARNGDAGFMFYNAHSRELWGMNATGSGFSIDSGLIRLARDATQLKNPPSSLTESLIRGVMSIPISLDNTPIFNPQ